MSRIKSRDNKLENKLSKLISSKFHKHGVRYKKYYSRLPGKPDIVFISRKIAVFADGDFWHGYNYKVKKISLPRKYWTAKIKRNIKRDGIVNKELEKMGWQVVRFWEHEINKKPEKIIGVMEKILAYKV